MIEKSPPHAYGHCRPSDRVKRKIADYVTQHGFLKTVALVGPPGTGKTWDMAGIANVRRTAKWFDDYSANIWISCATIDAVDRFKIMIAAAAGSIDPYGDHRNTETLGEVMDSISKISMQRYPAYVFLDDIGSRKTDGAMTRIFEILEIRSSRGLPTICTLNNDDKDQVDKRIKSRLNAGLVIDYSGMPDRRRSQTVVERMNEKP